MNRSVKRFCPLVPLVAVLAACGGGGDDGGGYGSISYSGRTDPALIDSTNARRYAVDSYTKERSGSSVEPSGLLQASSVSESSGRRGRLQGAMDVIGVALSGVRKGEGAFVLARGDSGMRAASTGSGRVEGPCGGSASFTISSNEQSGSFKGSLNYNGYCEGGITTNGPATISGTVDRYHERITSMSMRFDSLQSSGNGEALTMAGTMDLEVRGSTVTMTMDMLARDDQTGEVIKMENLQVSATAGAGYEERTINGRFYMPSEGYVEIETLMPFRVFDGDEWPSSGRLLITGATGTYGGTTRALLTVDSSLCSVEADTDGDNDYDYSSGTFSWLDEL